MIEGLPSEADVVNERPRNSHRGTVADEIWHFFDLPPVLRVIGSFPFVFQELPQARQRQRPYLRSYMPRAWVWLNAIGVMMGMPRNGLKTKRSRSPVTIMSA
jgi:hypothetical protein